ncbi:hypothetical protein [Amniculibacterium sp. G2-70]|uniref:hypothetical protein n=1 Tax=Amniculibacterium sp. G2-70 TaxID=2767188 RepID=UPI001654A6B0|nr:hypothetical protein [Amniculibacterium sp. G2-70]
MGHDISPIANHKLNTKDVKVLAEDICSRIDINIEYGYWGQKEHFKLLGENKDDENVILGKIIKNEKFKTFRLIDESYQLKQLHQKYGDNLFYNPEYWIYYDGKLPEEKWINEERKELVIPNFELTLISSDETEYLSIHKELYSNDIPYYSRWWSFCRLFTESNFDNFEYLEGLLEFRKELMKYTLAFGGDKIYYLDDQSSVLEGVGQGSEWELSWTEFEKFVADKTLPLMLDIPQFLTNRNYRNEFIEKKEYPLSFIDDFSDIK